MANDLAERLRKIATTNTCRLTHLGRKSGKPYQVTIWFIVDGEKILLPSANIGRNWVRNVRKNPHVEIAVDGEKFTGEARFLESAADHEKVQTKVRSKYWIAVPFFVISTLLAAVGIGKVNFGAFEVTLSG